MLYNNKLDLAGMNEWFCTLEYNCINTYWNVETVAIIIL